MLKKCNLVLCQAEEQQPHVCCKKYCRDKEKKLFMCFVNIGNVCDRV